MSDDPKFRRFNKYMESILPDTPLYDFRAKEQSVDAYISYNLLRTQSMFKWRGLPDTIPSTELEKMIQCYGVVAIYEHEGNLYAFRGNPGGVLDEYYRPTKMIITNPYFNLSVDAKIGDNCEIIRNDLFTMGLLPLMQRYATVDVETDLSIYIATINSRIVDLISAPDDRTKTSADKFLKDVEEGKLGSISSNAFLNGIQSQPYGGKTISDYISKLIELKQYNKASLFNEIGLNANYNMKRESINADESQLNNDALLPLIDHLLDIRQTDIKRVNDHFGCNISVDLASSWKDNQIEIDAEQEQLSRQPENEVNKNEGNKTAGGDNPELD